jgi:hypothetical protein
MLFDYHVRPNEQRRRNRETDRMPIRATAGGSAARAGTVVIDESIAKARPTRRILQQLTSGQ